MIDEAQIIREATRRFRACGGLLLRRGMGLCARCRPEPVQWGLVVNDKLTGYEALAFRDGKMIWCGDIRDLRWDLRKLADKVEVSCYFHQQAQRDAYNLMEWMNEHAS